MEQKLIDVYKWRKLLNLYDWDHVPNNVISVYEQDKAEQISENGQSHRPTFLFITLNGIKVP